MSGFVNNTSIKVHTRDSQWQQHMHANDAGCPGVLGTGMTNCGGWEKDSWRDKERNCFQTSVRPFKRR